MIKSLQFKYEYCKLFHQRCVFYDMKSFPVDEWKYYKNSQMISKCNRIVKTNIFFKFSKVLIINIFALEGK